MGEVVMKHGSDQATAELPGQADTRLATSVKIEEYDGSYACAICWESVRGDLDVLHCSQCRSNPIHRSCGAAAGFLNTCQACGRDGTMVAWIKDVEASGSESGAYVDLTKSTSGASVCSSIPCLARASEAAAADEEPMRNDGKEALEAPTERQEDEMATAKKRKSTFSSSCSQSSCGRSVIEMALETLKGQMAADRVEVEDFASESLTDQRRKRQDTSLKEMSAEGAATMKAASPEDEYQERLQRVMEEHGCIGSMLIIGIDGPERALTAQEMETLRHVLITKSREKALTKAMDFCTCGQADDACMIFNTRSGNEVILGIPRQIKSALSKKSLPARFDALFALTRGLQAYKFWMHDNECYGEGGELEAAIKALGRAWRNLLKKSDKELGIDKEFTRPGVEALLSRLERDLNTCWAAAEFGEFKLV